MRDALKVIVDTLKTSETGGTTFLDIRGGLAAFGYAVTAPGVESVDQIVDGSIAIAATSCAGSAARRGARAGFS